MCKYFSQYVLLTYVDSLLTWDKHWNETRIWSESDLRPKTSTVVIEKATQIETPYCSDKKRESRGKLIGIIAVGFQERKKLPAILMNAHNLRYTGPSGYRSEFLSPLFHIYKRGNGDKINNKLLGRLTKKKWYKSCGRFSRADGTRRSLLCRSRWRFYCERGSARLRATPRQQLRFRIMLRSSIVCPATLSSPLLPV